jgi:hypothetical protein
MDTQKTGKPVQKAYQIDFSRIEEGFLYSQTFTLADTRSKARTKLFKMSDGMQLYNGKELTIMNLPMIRCPQEDLYEFEGQKISQEKLEYLLKKRKRWAILDNILNDTDIEFCYIKKRGSYYRPHSCGYTDFQHRAGVYPKSEAVSNGKSCDELDIIPINTQEHNQMIKSEIEDLQTRLL